MVVTDIHHEVVNTQTTVSDVHRGVLNAETIVSEVQLDVANTRVVVSELQQSVADIHRTVVKDQEGTQTDGPRLAILNKIGSAISLFTAPLLANPHPHGRGHVSGATN